MDELVDLLQDVATGRSAAGFSFVQSKDRRLHPGFSKQAGRGLKTGRLVGGRRPETGS